ncbi:MAG: DUF3568 family protein [Candidatus Methylomirabilia bacterium]
MNELTAWWIVVALAAVSLFANQGCAAVGLTLLAAGTGTVAGAGVSHTLEGITYKTFTVPLAGLHKATLMTLKRMDIRVIKDEDARVGREIHAKAGDRDVEIELDKLTSRITRMRVVATKSWLIRDRATATEIILQTDQTLIDNPHLAAISSEELAPAARERSK